MKAFALTALGLMAVPTAARAQCECDHTVPLEARVVDGRALGVAPGDVVCLAEGESAGITLRGLRGEIDRPVVVRACGPRTLAGAGSVGISVDGAEHVRVTGESAPLIVRGFSRGIFVVGGSTGIELDHLEIDGASFVGIDVRTSPECDGTWARGSFVMDGLHIHHNHLQNVGSAMYLGELRCTAGISCDGGPVYPHPILNADVHDNRMERTGRTALKIACSPDAQVHHNTVIDYGTRDESGENNGLETREGSTVRLFSNVVRGGTGHGIFVKSESGTWVFNNVVVGAGGHGIALTGRSRDDVGYRFTHNTIVSPMGAGLLSWSPVGEARAANNLVVAAGEGAAALGGGWEMEGTLALSSLEEALFVDPDGADYALSEGSPAIDAGVATEVVIDFLGLSRDSSPDVGAFEHGATIMPDAGVEEPDAGAATIDAGARGGDASVRGGGDAGPMPQRDAGAGESAGGCSVRPVRSSSTWMGWLLGLALVVSRRRQRSRG